MIQMGIWIAFLFIATNVLTTPALSVCDHEDLKICVSTLKDLLDMQFRKLKSTEEELDKYCQAMKTDSVCLNEALDSCEETGGLADGWIPFIRTFSASLEAYQKDFCVSQSPQRQRYLQIFTCLAKHENEFKNCQDKEYKAFLYHSLADSFFQSFCRAVGPSMECMEKAGLKTCGHDAKKLVASLLVPRRELLYEECKHMMSLAGRNLASYLSFILPALLAAVI